MTKSNIQFLTAIQKLNKKCCVIWTICFIYQIEKCHFFGNLMFWVCQICVEMHYTNVQLSWGSRTSHLWQSMQSRSAEAELQIFGSPDMDEIWKWTYPYLEVLAEQVREMNEIFLSPGRAEVRKAELQIFGSQDRAEVRKRNFTSLKVPTEMKCGSGLTHIWKSWQNKCRRWTRSSKS